MYHFTRARGRAGLSKPPKLGQSLASADPARGYAVPQPPQSRATANAFSPSAVCQQDDLLPQRACCPWRCAMTVQHVKPSEQAREDTSPRKINVTSYSPVGEISVVTLIRTDTTLDHSQKAVKVCIQCLANASAKCFLTFEACDCATLI